MFEVLPKGLAQIPVASVTLTQTQRLARVLHVELKVR